MRVSTDRAHLSARWRRSTVRARRAATLVACAPLASIPMMGCAGSAASSRSATAQPAKGGKQAKAVSPSSTTAAAPQTTTEKVPVANITLKSAAPINPLPARYTCDGANASLPLSWSRVPAGTRELDLFVVSALPVKGKFEVAWALAGLRPSVRKLPSGSLPAGVVVGRSSSGQNKYSLCPPKHSTAHYAVLLYAVPRKVAVKPGFDAEALFEGKLVHIAPSEGEVYFSYNRK